MKSTDDKGEAIESLSTEERPYTMGAGLLPEEFEEKLVGLKKGQTAEFDLDMPANPPVLLRALDNELRRSTSTSRSKPSARIRPRGHR